jgi:signal transduction histidine kinase
MEALVDGVLDTTPERLARIRDAMVVCGTLLDDLKKQYRAPLESHAQAAEFDICDLITSEVSLVGAVAESKNVLVRYQPPNPHPRSWAHYRGDRDRVALIVRDVLLGAVRFTPPGGSVEIRCAPPEVEFSVSTAAQRDGEALGFSVAAKLLDTLGGQARIVTENERSATFVLRLPTGPTTHDG